MHSISHCSKSTMVGNSLICEIVFKPTLSHSNADGLSRLPLPMTEATKEAPEEVSVFNVSQVHTLPVTFHQVS